MIDDNRDMTTDEIRWLRRLLRCLNDMPPNIEMCVTYRGTVEIRNIGAEQRFFNENGHVDNVPVLGTFTPKTTSRIVGRESMI